MYLFVFIFLLISILGLYTQVYTLQSAKMFEKQTAIGQVMLTWAGSAYDIAKFYTLTNSDGTAIGPIGCILSPNLVITGTQNCSIQIQDPATITQPAGPGRIPQLPVGYNWAAYKWNSIYYVIGTQKFVITYVLPPASGNRSDPVDAPPVGFSIGSIFQQISNTKTWPRSYGFVDNANQLISKGGDIYALPTLSTPIQQGSLAIIVQL